MVNTAASKSSLTTTGYDGRVRACGNRWVLHVDQGHNDADHAEVAKRREQKARAEPKPERGEGTSGDQFGGYITSTERLPAGCAATALPVPANDRANLAQHQRGLAARTAAGQAQRTLSLRDPRYGHGRVRPGRKACDRRCRSRCHVRGVHFAPTVIRAAWSLSEEASQQIAGLASCRGGSVRLNQPGMAAVSLEVTARLAAVALGDEMTLVGSAVPCGEIGERNADRKGHDGLWRVGSTTQKRSSR